MKNYQAATDSKFDPMADGLGSPFQGASELRNVHHEWMNLHHATRINLLEFEQVDFELPGEASGVEGVRDLVSATAFDSLWCFSISKSARQNQRHRKTL